MTAVFSAALSQPASELVDPCRSKCAPGGICKKPTCGRIRSSELMQAYGTEQPASPAPEAMARRFHDAYERLAPTFGYETRAETRDFDPQSPNGKLMIAVCSSIAQPAAPEAPTVEQAIQTLVTALAERKGWMRDYADSVVRDAVDRRERGAEGERS